MKLELKDSQILEELTVCMYCQNTWNEKNDVYGCCGDNHSSNAYITLDNDIYLEHEVEIIDDYLSPQDIEDIKGDIQLDIEKDK